jgi:predicted metalloprotease with PDZ domain
MYDEFYVKSPNSSYYLRGRGYQAEDVERVITEMAGPEFYDFFKRHVRDVEVLPYDEAFGYTGLRLIKTQAKEPYNAGLSLEVADPETLVIENVSNNSPAEAVGLQKGDEIVTLGSKKVSDVTWLKTLARYRKGDAVSFVVKRDRRTIKGEMILGDPDRYEYRIEEKTNVTEQQRALRTAWLNGK